MRKEKDMSPVLLEVLGLRYPTDKSNQRRRYGLYQCQYCGKEFEAMLKRVKDGTNKSCGCLTKITHGLKNHRLYQIWKGMYHRCHNKSTPNYPMYGGRGIKVCERWLDMGNFIEDMYPSFVEGLTLDRIDVDGNYEPDNCRWATSNTQAQNTRDIMSTNTSGFRGVSWDKASNKWSAGISVNNKSMRLGRYPTALEAAKAYETYVRLNNLEHNFTPALTEEEVEELNKVK